jgi:hypothetical protein
MNVKTLYHDLRRASSTKTANNPRHWNTSKSAIIRAGQIAGVKVPRGMGLIRDRLAEALSSAREFVEVPQRTAIERFPDMLRNRYAAVIQSRGGETWIENNQLETIEHGNGFTLLACEGWRQYSRSYGKRFAQLAYLCGMDDNGPWAVRVPGNIKNIAAAVDFIEPAAVKTARNEGRKIIRQGDVYFIEQARDNMSALEGTRHVWDSATRTVRHKAENAHNAAYLPFKAKAVVQSVLRMGRVTGRRQGD